MGIEAEERQQIFDNFGRDWDVIASWADEHSDRWRRSRDGVSRQTNLPVIITSGQALLQKIRETNPHCIVDETSLSLALTDRLSVDARIKKGVRPPIETNNRRLLSVARGQGGVPDVNVYGTRLLAMTAMRGLFEKANTTNE